MSKNLESILPNVRGRYLFDVPLATTTWFRVGGCAQVTFKPADVQDLCYFLQNRPKTLPIHVIGVGSNLLVRDGGVEGVVIRLGQGFTNTYVKDTTVDVGAAVLDRNLANLMCQAGMTGFEFLCGIPGTIGGALRMNAGAYGADISQILVHALVVDSKGCIHRLTVDEMGFSYRYCALPKDWIFIGARFKGEEGDIKEIETRMTTLLEERERTQPVKSRTGGSTFANPPGVSAWELIDKAGCRGLKKGDAVISELHANFMLNLGQATAADLEALGEEVKQRVLETSGIDLRWEIERVGYKDLSLLGEKAA